MIELGHGSLSDMFIDIDFEKDKSLYDRFVHWTDSSAADKHYEQCIPDKVTNLPNNFTPFQNCAFDYSFVC